MRRFAVRDGILYELFAPLAAGTRAAAGYRILMPTRIPSTQEHSALVSAFRTALRQEPMDQIVDRILHPDASFCLDAPTRQLLTNDIARQFECQNATITIVGSAQLGFSTVAKPMKPRYRPFSLESDIDVAIVSSDFFDRVWEGTFLHFIEERPWPHVQDFQKYFFRGWIRPDKLPYNTSFRSTWFDYFRQLSRDQFDSEHAVTCALYKSNAFLREYHKRSISECQDAEEMQ